MFSISDNTSISKSIILSRHLLDRLFIPSTLSKTEHNVHLKITKTNMQLYPRNIAKTVNTAIVYNSDMGNSLI